MSWVRRNATSLCCDLLAVVVAGLLTHRMLFGAGYGLAHDMVFTPHQPLSWDALGLGSAAPRAVPVDGVVALLETVVDGSWVGRAVVFGVLVLAGAGAHRLAPSWIAPARLAAAGFAIWNPFVVERLAIGQWALLAGYAALPWLVAALRRYVADGRRVALAAPVLTWLGLAAITPTGAVIAGVTAVVVAGRRAAPVWLAALLVQLPWLVPALLSPAGGTSDPAGVAAFATRTERPGGPLVSLLGLGGLWDADAVPPSRTGGLGYLTTVVVVVGLVIGAPAVAGAVGRPVATRFAGVASAGLVLALLSAVPGGDALMRWLVRSVPGAGLLRDGQKWLIPFAVLAVLCVAGVVQTVGARLRRAELIALVGLVGVLLPALLLPDAIATADRALTPARYPSDFAAVARLVDGHGAVVTLPFEAYRRFGWAPASSVADPASRWFDTTVISSDQLRVDGVLLQGEDPVAARTTAALDARRPLRAVLEADHARWALVYRVAGAAAPATPSGMQVAYRGPHLLLWRLRVPGAVTRAPSLTTRVLVAAVDATTLAAVLVATAIGAVQRVRRDALPH